LPLTHSSIERMIPRLKHKVNQLLDFGRLIKSPMLLIIQLIMFITKTMTWAVFPIFITT
jgi:hypothetical protein